jgi:hypothetical protein
MIGQTGLQPIFADWPDLDLELVTSYTSAAVCSSSGTYRLCTDRGAESTQIRFFTGRA